MIISITTLLPAKELKKLNENKIPDWWYQISESDKWDYYASMANIYIDAREIIDEKININDRLKMMLKKNDEFIKKHTPFYPKFGFSSGVNFRIDTNLKLTWMLNSDFYIFFFKRFMFIPGFDIQIYSNQNNRDFSAGAKIAFGVLF